MMTSLGLEYMPVTIDFNKNLMGLIHLVHITADLSNGQCSDLYLTELCSDLILLPFVGMSWSLVFQDLHVYGFYFGDGREDNGL
jgi:hypothetical protein